ncbi:hypothetical protein ROE7235_00708 [Roseibaca ekhonensis]|uniref:Uncharacterized protein n=1 Tax=Roseinatronobacter ekhonensis TaxID=254356 RepID=A0A3B0MIM9_9RHOB|nr:hypothetical protein ROE7235_00708 [Roseibaca ekhonensis]
MGNIVSTIRRLGLNGLHDKMKTLRGSTPQQAPRRGSRASMSHVAQTFLRGILVAVFVLLPAMLLPGISQDVAQAATLIALISAAVVMAEYAAAYPGLIEFRDAKPYNRLRFGMIVVVVLALTLLQRSIATGESDALTATAIWLAGAFDFSFSPMRLLVLSLPQGLPVQHLLNVMASATLAFIMCLMGVLVFIATMFAGYWPAKGSSFNVWINLPNFDPTKGVDVVQRLERDSQVNVLLGIILPFSLPVLLRLSSLLVQPITFEASLTLVWGVALWAFIPISLIMRGIAMYRVAQLIRAQRRRIAEEEAAVPLPARSAYS